MQSLVLTIRLRTRSNRVAAAAFAGGFVTGSKGGGIGSSSGPFAWLNQFRRLRVRYDKRADIHEAFLSLGCAWICWQSLRRTG